MPAFPLLQAWNLSVRTCMIAIKNKLVAVSREKREGKVVSVTKVYSYVVLHTLKAVYKLCKSLKNCQKLVWVI